MSSVPVPTCDHCPGPADTINGLTGRHCTDCPPHRFLPPLLAFRAARLWMAGQCADRFGAAAEHYAEREMFALAIERAQRQMDLAMRWHAFPLPVAS